jgi:hypothetical protein
MDLGPRSRHDHGRRNASHAQRAGRVHSRMPIHPRGSADQHSQGKADHVRVDREARSSRTYPQRQRFGVHRERAAQLACQGGHQDALHRAWKPLVPPLRETREELQRAFPRGVPQPRAALDSDRGSSGNRRLAMEVQQHTPPSLAGLYCSTGVRSGTAGGKRTEPMLGLQSA